MITQWHSKKYPPLGIPLSRGFGRSFGRPAFELCDRSQHLAAMTERLGSLVHNQGAALEALGRLGPAVRDVASRAVAVVQPALRQIAGPMRERRRQAIEQQHKQERAARPSRGPSLGM